MNWRRLFAVSQIVGVVGGMSVTAAGLYAVIVIGVCRKIIGLSDSIACFGVGLPFFIISLMLFVKFLPGRLRQAGMLSDDPSRFGPWFKD
jgi:hypothetical protein